MARHIVSAASSETGIAGASTPCAFSFAAKLSAAKGIEESKSKIKDSVFKK